LVLMRYQIGDIRIWIILGMLRSRFVIIPS
jgi:hypothetical protein